MPSTTSQIPARPLSRSSALKWQVNRRMKSTRSATRASSIFRASSSRSSSFSSGFSSACRPLRKSSRRRKTPSRPSPLLCSSFPFWQSSGSASFYRKVGRMIKSESVEATSKDSRNDVIATSVVLLGAVITMLTGVNLDGYMGAAVALFIVFSGVQLTISTADPLLGQAPEGRARTDHYRENALVPRHHRHA